MDCKQAAERITALVDDELPSAERAELESHLAECPTCRDAMEDERAVAERLRSAPRPPLPDGFRDRVLSAVNAAPAPGERPAGRLLFPGAWFAAATAAAAAVVAMILVDREPPLHRTAMDPAVETAAADGARRPAGEVRATDAAKRVLDSMSRRAGTAPTGAGGGPAPPEEAGRTPAPPAGADSAGKPGAGGARDLAGRVDARLKGAREDLDDGKKSGGKAEEERRTEAEPAADPVGQAGKSTTDRYRDGPAAPPVAGAAPRPGREPSDEDGRRLREEAEDKRGDEGRRRSAEGRVRGAGRSIIDGRLVPTVALHFEAEADDPTLSGAVREVERILREQRGLVIQKVWATDADVGSADARPDGDGTTSSREYGEAAGEEEKSKPVADGLTSGVAPDLVASVAVVRIAASDLARLRQALGKSRALQETHAEVLLPGSATIGGGAGEGGAEAQPPADDAPGAPSKGGRSAEAPKERDAGAPGEPVPPPRLTPEQLRRIAEGLPEIPPDSVTLSLDSKTGEIEVQIRLHRARER